MKITVLDGYALNPGDLSWDGFRGLGEVAIYDRTPKTEVVERSRGSEVLLTNKTPLSRAILEQLDGLRYIGVLATGHNVVDIAAAAQLGVPVTNIPAYGTESVAQHVFALILELSRRCGHHSEEVSRGRWTASPDFCFWDTPQVELTGKTLGIVGLGMIGRAVARIAAAFGMRVIAHSRTERDPLPDAGFAWRSLGRLLEESDFVSLHCPLLPETAGMINGERLERMKPTSYLINTARGGLIDEQALADALEGERIAGAALDVMAVEPPSSTTPLIAAPNLIVTPHIAWAAHEARERLMGTAVENLRAFLAGTPKNLVR